MSDRIEYCAECGDPTGRAGPLDDSLYPGGEGPYCEDCFSEWPDWKVAEITTLRQQLADANEENERVRQANLDVMMHFEDMKAAKEKAEARATRLSEALQVAVDTPELGGGTWYDMAVAALALSAAKEAGDE